METKINKSISRRPPLRTLQNKINTQWSKEGVNKSKILKTDKCEQIAKITEPSKKTTLLRKIEKRYMNDSQAILLEKKLYEDNIQKEYVKHLLYEEWKYIPGRDFVERTVFTLNSRFVIVNWLLKIQQLLMIPENEFYLAVKIMDSSSHTCVDSKEGTLHALTSLWIVHKFSNNSVLIPASKLILILNNTFSSKDILTMERKILSAIKFGIMRPEPSIFLEHYLRKTKQNENKNIYIGSFFVCDCLSMFPKFSSVESSFIAAISLYTTLIVLKEDTYPLLCLMKNVYNEELLKSASRNCLKKIHQIEHNEFREPFVKYSSSSLLNISTYFEKCDKFLSRINY